MSMFLPQNKFSKKIGGPLLVACFALTVVGCSRTEQKDNQSSSASSVDQNQHESSAVACNNEKATNAIHSYLVSRIEQQAKKQSDIIQQQANTAVDMTILQNGLSQVAINLESVNGSNGKCQATVSFNMPQSQLDNADKIYTRLKLPVAAEQVVSHGYQLQNSTLVANKIGFGVSANNGNYQVINTTGDDVIGLVGEIMANSALAQTLTQPSNMPMSGSTSGNVPAIVPPTSSKPSVSVNNTEKSTTHSVKKHTTKPVHDSEKSTTKTTITTTENTTTEVKTKITPAKTNSHSDNSDKKSSKKDDTTKSNSDSKITTTKSNSSSNSEKSSKPATHEKVPTDTNVKLNIEEKNEQY